MAKTACAGKIKRGRKFDQVLEGARRIFMRDGFDGANVDDIAAEANVSKATLYSYFPDKRALFAEMVMSESARQAEEAEALVNLSAPPATVLPFVARRMVDYFLSEYGRNIFRICVAESERFPELGQHFYDTGPGMIRQKIASYLNGAIARGELVIEDTLLAADQFTELCKADIFPCVCCGLKRDYTEADRARIVKGAVEMFLARYGAARSSPKNA
ncbi:MAG: TetR/AcrR family transcriptional regulator [Paracoccaceae bacterium]|nr:TetR/AcrR family transcriptional regulator [Paracoccaceae bacterium]MDH5531468.1 TetR/AcrR family transcriptional regulator [Paracoccaceae bacterium]